MTISMVQHQAVTESTAMTSLSFSPASPTAAGNLLVLCVAYHANVSTLTSITDSKNSWSTAGSIYANLRSAEIWYVANAAAESITNTITINVSGSATLMVATFFEFNPMGGAVVLDPTGLATGAQGASTAPSITALSGLMGTKDMAVGLISADGPLTTITSVTGTGGGSWNALSQIDSTYGTAAENMVATYAPLTSATGLSLSATLNASSNWAALVVNFRGPSPHSATPAGEILTTVDTGTLNPTRRAKLGRVVNDVLAALKTPLAGLATRGGQPLAGYGGSSTQQGPVSIYVLSVNWSDLQPSHENQSVGGTVGDSAIQAAISWVDGHLGSSLKVRVFCGANAPTWAKDYSDSSGAIAAPFTMVDMTGAPNSGTLGAWWTTLYIKAYADLMTQLATAYDSVLEIGEIVISGAATIFSEPFIRQATDPNGPNGINAPTLDILLRTGYTTANDKAAITAMINHAGGAFKNTYLSLACNPYEGAFSSATGQSSGSTATYLQDMNQGWSTGQWTGGAMFINAPSAPIGDLVASVSGHTVGVGNTLPSSTPSWLFYAGGAYYTITSISGTPATTINLDPTGPAPPTTLVGLNYSIGFAAAVTGTSAQRLYADLSSIPVGVVGALYSVVLLQSTGDQEAYTYTQMQVFRGFPRSVLGNNSFNATTGLGSPLYNDLIVNMGPPLYFQTQPDSGISGTSTDASNPLYDTLALALQARANYVELPPSYGGMDSGSNPVITTLTLADSSKSWASDVWGNGPGMYGIVEAGGSTAFVYANTGNQLNLVAPGWWPSTPSSPASYNVYKWDYLDPTTVGLSYATIFRGQPT